MGRPLVLVVMIAMAGVALEKRTLELRRSVSRQHYQMDLLHDAYALLTPTWAQSLDALRERALVHHEGQPQAIREPVRRRVDRAGDDRNAVA